MIACIAVGSLLFGGSAFATSETNSLPTVASVPDCVKLTQWDTITDSRASVRSSCVGTYRMRFIWAWERDGNCFSLAPGGYHEESRRGRAPHVTELRLC